uniref:SERF-like protein n=1 Tax=Simulium vittatum TaxID=7192 RepID=B5M0V3_SIMVI|nr:SERF-like protein [Simulium vittatum]
MTRGNQRELARAKNMKKNQAVTSKQKQSEDGLTFEQRKERDAQLMREKQKKKLEAAEAANSKS